MEELLAERRLLEAKLKNLDREINDLKTQSETKLEVLVTFPCSGGCKDNIDTNIFDYIVKSPNKTVTREQIWLNFGQFCSGCDTSLDRMVDVGLLSFNYQQDDQFTRPGDSFTAIVDEIKCHCVYPTFAFGRSGSYANVTKSGKSTEWCPSYKGTSCQLLYNGKDFVLFNSQTHKFLEWTFESAGSGLAEEEFCPNFGEYSFLNPETKNKLTIEDFANRGIPVTNISLSREISTTKQFLEERNER